jgi:hypothetical protein
MTKLTILLALLLAVSSCTKEMPVPDSDAGSAYNSGSGGGTCDPNNDPGYDPGDYSGDDNGNYSGGDDGDYSNDDGDDSGDDGSDDSGDDSGNRYKPHKHHVAQTPSHSVVIAP